MTLVIPVYNEGENLAHLWEVVRRDIKTPLEAFVIYDFDDDNTVPVAQAIASRGEPLRLVKNRFGHGVVGALRTGFEQVRERGPILVVMADLSDDLAQVDQMVALYLDGYDVVAGSRYMKGGRIVGGPWLKKTISRLAGVSLHFLRRLPTHDATNAFKIYDSQMLRDIDLESRNGFELNLEITVKAFLRGSRIAEVPTTWRDRTRGESRFQLWKWLPSYLRWYVFAFQPRRRQA